METPSIPDNDGEVCWELDVELEFRLQECHVFIVVWKLQLVLDRKELLHFSFPFHHWIVQVTKSVEFNSS